MLLPMADSSTDSCLAYSEILTDIRNHSADANTMDLFFQVSIGRVGTSRNIAAVQK